VSQEIRRKLDRITDVLAIERKIVAGLERLLAGVRAL